MDFALFTLSGNQMDGGAFKDEGFTDLIFQETQVRKVHELFFIDEDDKGRWLNRNLGRIKDFQAFALIGRSRIDGHGIHDNIVEDTGRNSCILALTDAFNQLWQLVQALLGLSRDKDDRSITQELEIIPNIFFPLAGRVVVFFNCIPLVDEIIIPLPASWAKPAIRLS